MVTVVLELPADRIARRIIDVVSSHAYHVTCGWDVITPPFFTHTGPPLLPHIAALTIVMDRVLDRSSYLLEQLLDYFCQRMDMDLVHPSLGFDWVVLG